MGYIDTSQQLFLNLFKVGDRYVLLFGLFGALALACMSTSLALERRGMGR